MEEKLHQTQVRVLDTTDSRAFACAVSAYGAAPKEVAIEAITAPIIQIVTTELKVGETLQVVQNINDHDEGPGYEAVRIGFKIKRILGGAELILQDFLEPEQSPLSGISQIAYQFSMPACHLMLDADKRFEPGLIVIRSGIESS